MRETEAARERMRKTMGAVILLGYVRENSPKGGTNMIAAGQANGRSNYSDYVWVVF